MQVTVFFFLYSFLNLKKKKELIPINVIQMSFSYIRVCGISRVVDTSCCVTYITHNIIKRIDRYYIPLKLIFPASWVFADDGDIM